MSVIGTAAATKGVRATDRGIKGPKGQKRRANAVFVDTHVELRRNAPKNMFTPEQD